MRCLTFYIGKEVLKPDKYWTGRSCRWEVWHFFNREGGPQTWEAGYKCCIGCVNVHQVKQSSNQSSPETWEAGYKCCIGCVNVHQVKQPSNQSSPQTWAAGFECCIGCVNVHQVKQTSNQSSPETWEAGYKCCSGCMERFCRHRMLMLCSWRQTSFRPWPILCMSTCT
jgi:hypothetical protein